MDSTPAQWDIYAKQMFHHKLGYPLWVPDPAPQGAEVEIGDVGWLDQGEFHPIFNSMRSAEDRQPSLVPDDFVPLAIHPSTIHGPREKITQPLLCSRSIQCLDVAAGVSASASIGAAEVAAGASFKFHCTEDCGALLMLDPTGVSTEIVSKIHITTYMRTHFSKWVQLANGVLGLGLRDEDLMFVSGTIKTSRWAVAAFHGDYSKKQGSVTGKLGSLASLEFSVAISDIRLDSSYCRVGPPKYRNVATSSSPSAVEVAMPLNDSLSSPDKHDQSIFLHYWKMKRRPFLPSTPIRATAGPHRLPDWGGDGADMTHLHIGQYDLLGDDIEQVPASEQPYDPVNALLDYILQNSEADVAIACDANVFSLFVEQDLPDDIPTALLVIKPAIVTIEGGVGMLSSAMDIPDSPTPRALLDGSDAPANRARQSHSPTQSRNMPSSKSVRAVSQHSLRSFQKNVGPHTWILSRTTSSTSCLVQNTGPLHWSDFPHTMRQWGIFHDLAVLSESVHSERLTDQIGMNYLRGIVFYMDSVGGTSVQLNTGPLKVVGLSALYDDVADALHMFFSHEDGKIRHVWSVSVPASVALVCALLLDLAATRSMEARRRGSPEAPSQTGGRKLTFHELLISICLLMLEVLPLDRRYIASANISPEKIRNAGRMLAPRA